MVTTPETSLTKPEVYETRQIQLNSPLLHIGSAVSQLYPSEYVATSKRVYYPNPESLATVMKERGQLTEFLQRVENREDLTPLLRQVLGDDWQSALDAEGKSIFPAHTSSRRWTEQTISLLRPMIRNGFGQLYIPGSSIKGAIRTAIAYHLLKHGDRYGVPKQARVSEIETRLRQSMGNLRQKAKFADDALFMDDLFTNFELPAPHYRKGPNTDFMRAVHVTDTPPLVEQRLEQRGKPISVNLPVVAEVIISSRFPDYKAKYRASLFVEMVRNVNTTFTLSIDAEMLSWFRHSQGMKLPFRSVQDILNLCQEFAQDQWDFEHDYWADLQDNPRAAGKNLNFSEIRHFYEPEKCRFGLRLGWGTGMAGTTIGLLLDDHLRSQVRDTVGLKAPEFEAPKSKRTVVDPKGQIKFLPGWINLKTL
jgi:CRISPR-associated protein Csm5